MTTFDTTLHFLSVLLPTASVFLFLLLQQRQSIRAELEDTQMRRASRERQHADETQRHIAITNMIAAFAPTMMATLERTFPRPRVPATAADLPDQDLVAEVERRMSTGDWKERNPFGPLDDLLEHVFADGVEVPADPSASDSFVDTSNQFIHQAS